MALKKQFIASLPLVEGSAQMGKIGVDKSNIKYKDISLKDFCKTRKGNEKTVFKLFMEVVKKPLLRMLIDEDFQNTETAIDMRTDLSFPSKKSYKSILNNLKERIYKYTSQNVELKTDKIVSWENLKPCPFRQKNSKDITVCRNKNVPINTSFLTPQACELCVQVTEEMTQLEQITGVKPRLREYKALKIIKQQVKLKNDEIQAIRKNLDFYKHEVEQNRSQRHTQNNTLEIENEKLVAQIDKLIDEQKSLEREFEEKQRQKFKSIQRRLRGFKVRCPQNGQTVSVSENCIECQKLFDCSIYGQLVYLE